MTRRIVLLLIATSIALLGCGPPWQVVRQATPSPLVGVKTFALKPIDFTGLKVGEKTEQGYLAEKDEDTRANWTGDKKAMNEEFTKTLLEGTSEAGIAVKPGGEADFTIEPQVPWLEPGFYAAVVNKASEVHLTLIIRDKAGKVVDEVTMTHSTAANLTNPAVGNRLRDDAEALGEYAAEYVRSRVSPEA